ncbi:hypothetical protein AX15_000547 [Amanita polypyramis BW_CC]|nr:hypothetical protein AX15_000547 [Amanita polypyramis BW_CC]
MHAAQLEIKDMQHIDEYVRFSFVFDRVAEWSDCEKLYICMMEMGKAKLGEDHPHILSSMGNLASTYWNQGRWDEAENMDNEEVAHEDQGEVDEAAALPTGFIRSMEHLAEPGNSMPLHVEQEQTDLGVPVSTSSTDRLY